MAKYVKVPKEIEPLFKKAEIQIHNLFSHKIFNPSKAKVEISGERYIYLRASSLSIDFYKIIFKLFQKKGKETSNITKQFLFDIAHAVGISDAHHLSKKLHLHSPLEKLSAGPVHFSFTGWAFVDILPESKPTPDENFFLIYNHPYSFESDSWIKAKKQSNHPVCIMNAGYSSGWCEESFGIPLVAVEILCRAKGDAHCQFIMAPPEKIAEHLKAHINKLPISFRKKASYDVPEFFELKKIQEKLREANTNLSKSSLLMKSITGSATDGIVLINDKLNVIFWNEAASEIFGFTKKNMLRKNILSKIISKKCKKDCEKIFLAFFKKTTPFPRKRIHELNAITQNRKKISVELSVSKTIISHQSYLVLIFRDITFRKKIMEKIHYQATHDMLTHVLNRHAFIQQTEELIVICRRENKKMALLFVDLDQFKQINDQFGHVAGDTLLKDIAKRLKKSLRKSDLVARIGGDEFLLLFYNVRTLKDVFIVRQKLIEILSPPFKIKKNVELTMQFSIGIAMFPIHGKTFHDLLKHSDKEMYVVKKSKCNNKT